MRQAEKLRPALQRVLCLTHLLTTVASLSFCGVLLHTGGLSACLVPSWLHLIAVYDQTVSPGPCTPPETSLPSTLPAGTVGASGVIAGKTCPVLRKRVLTTSPAGHPVWVNVESYSVLFTTGGPPPSK